MKIENILSALENEKVNYAVAGGVAIVLYGYIRFTKDIDLIVDFSEKNILRLAKALTALGFKPGVPIRILDMADPDMRRTWIKEKNALVITFYNPRSRMLQIDILIDKDLSRIRTVRKKLRNMQVTIVSLEDLIKMKKESGRPQDMLDIEKLREVGKEKK
jgi:hypothetical protein